MKIYYTNYFLLGLYSFLNQISLSIHRGIDNWSELKIYAREKGMRSTTNKILESNMAIKYQIHNSLIKRIYSSVIKSNYVTDVEWIVLNELLNNINALLDADFPDKNKQIELRVSLCNFMFKIRYRLKLNKTILCLADRVQHFHENERCVHYTINQIVANVNYYMSCNVSDSIWQCVE